MSQPQKANKPAKVLHLQAAPAAATPSRSNDAAAA
jgi:hypothetical protein